MLLKHHTHMYVRTHTRTHRQSTGAVFILLTERWRTEDLEPGSEGQAVEGGSSRGGQPLRSCSHSHPWIRLALCDA